MDASGVIKEIRNKLGYNTGLEELLIAEAIAEAQDILERREQLPWFLETELIIAGSGSSAPRPTYDHPADFLREQEETAFWFQNADLSLSPMRKISRNDVMQLGNKALNTGDRYYYTMGTAFHFLPVLDLADTLYLYYYKKETTLLSGGSLVNGWSKHAPYALVGRAGMLLTSNIRDVKGYKIFSDLFVDEIMNLERRNIALRQSGEVLQRGGDD